MTKLSESRETRAVSRIFKRSENDYTIVELVYSPSRNKTGFAVFDVTKDGSLFRLLSKYKEEEGVSLLPYSPDNTLIKDRVVLLPELPEEYGTEEQLVKEIRSFIHRYVDLSKEFETVATYFVLLSWIYDSFNELPYLRKKGDFGSGKTRFLQVVGSICYKPIFASGGASTASLFHILNEFRGTLVMDEADFRFSNESADIAKILNNGNSVGFPILRCTSKDGKEYSPTSFKVFSPKLVATRSTYSDDALESRFVTQNFNPKKVRSDIPSTLPEDFHKQATKLRNMLLQYRFKNFFVKRPLLSKPDDMESRSHQIYAPLLSIIKDENDRKEVIQLAYEHSKEVAQDRSENVEAKVLAVIKKLIKEEKPLSISQITSGFFLEFGENYSHNISPKWIGGVVRKRLGLKTKKSNGVYVVDEVEFHKLQQLFERYDIPL